MTRPTYQPISATDNTTVASTVVAEHEHVQLPLLDDDKHIHPGFRLGALACRLPVLLAAQHALLSPWRAKQRKLFVRNADLGRDGRVASCTATVILLCLSDDRVR